MKYFNWRIILGIVLLALGISYLLQTLHVLTIGALPWALLFMAGGAAFISVLVTDRKNNWWAAIPGVVLAALGLMIAIDSIFPQLDGRFSGAVFLLGIGVAFWMVYLLNNSFWWAIIPAGVLTTLSGVTLVGENAFLNGGVVFFFGLAVTFGLLAILPNGGVKMSWPWIPAAALLFMAFVVSITTSSLLNYLWPVVLILLGLYFLWQTFRPRPSA